MATLQWHDRLQLAVHACRHSMRSDWTNAQVLRVNGGNQLDDFSFDIPTS